jgi:4a-hydroxytetrahydrobiopterin dehydratase
MTLLNNEQIDESLQASAWRRAGDELVRDLELADFAAAMGLANKVAAVAEEHDHHPDILIHGWNKLRLTVATHSEGGITQMDIDFARAVDSL